MDGDGRADIVGFGEAGTYVELAPPAGNPPVVLSKIAEGQGRGFAVFGGTDARLAGDVNGDGRPDLLLTGASDGAAYVVFGKTDIAPVSLASLAAGVGGGFRVGSTGNAFAVPDLNGDGRDEILANGGPDGPVLVFGKPDAAPVDLAAAAAGTGGYAIIGEPGRLPLVATGVAPDLNGDGLAELLLSSPGRPAWDPRVGPLGIPTEPGHAYVAFGTASGPVELGHVASGEGGLLLVGGEFPATVSFFAQFKTEATPVTDFDGDGRPDLLARDQVWATDRGGYLVQRYTVVFAPSEGGVIGLDAAAAGEGGRLITRVGAPPSTVDNRSVFVLPDPETDGPGGIAIVQGPERFAPPWGTTMTIGGDLPPSAGPSSAENRGLGGVVPVADLDGDDRPELLLGGAEAVRPEGAPYDLPGAPVSYLVFSGGGDAVIGGQPNRPTGTSADLSGDALPELLLVGPSSGYVLFGRTNETSIDLEATAAQGVGGVTLQGDVASLRSIPDLTGDGRPELLAQGSDGTAYVVFNDPLWIT